MTASEVQENKKKIRSELIGLVKDSLLRQATIIDAIKEYFPDGKTYLKKTSLNKYRKTIVLVFNDDKKIIGKLSKERYSKDIKVYKIL